MAHTSNKIPIRLLLDGNERTARCYQVPPVGVTVILDGNPYQVTDVTYHFPSARIVVTLDDEDSCCSLCELRDKLEDISDTVDDISDTIDRLATATFIPGL